MNSNTLAMKLIAVLGSATLVFLVGCGGNTNQPPPPMAITVAPSSATVQTGGVQQFTATVGPSGANQAVTWSLSGTGCTGASCGTIDATGKYTAAGTSPSSVAVDPSGKFTYVANSASLSVSMYTINASTGVLTSIVAIGAGLYPESVAVDPSGKFAYVANNFSNSISMYTIDAATGALTLIGTIGM